MKYAVILVQGHQHKVSEGDEILIDKLDGKPEAEVLLIADGKKSKVGTPTVKGAKITLKVLEDEVKGDKLHVKKFKAKSRYRRKIGFRPRYSKVKIEKIAS